MGQMGKNEIEGSGVNQLLGVLRAKIPSNKQLLYFGRVVQHSPLQVKLDHIPDLLGWEDIVMLHHCRYEYGDVLVLLSVDGGGSFVALGNS